MNSANRIEKFRKLLQKRQNDILETSRAHRDEVNALKNQERDPEYEENAQTELADYTLSHLLETQRRELMLIEAAYERMKQGEYGTCIDCGMEISVERLEALPFALRCEEDAETHEAHLRARGGMQMPSL